MTAEQARAAMTAAYGPLGWSELITLAEGCVIVSVCVLMEDGRQCIRSGVAAPDGSDHAALVDRALVMAVRRLPLPAPAGTSAPAGKPASLPATTASAPTAEPKIDDATAQKIAGLIRTARMKWSVFASLYKVEKLSDLTAKMAARAIRELENEIELDAIAERERQAVEQ